jgi:hypothetical protein
MVCGERSFYVQWFEVRGLFMFHGLWWEVFLFSLVGLVVLLCSE